MSARWSLVEEYQDQDQVADVQTVDGTKLLFTYEERDIEIF